MLVTHPQEFLRYWLMDQIGYGRFDVPATFFGKVVNNRLVAVAGYSGYNKETSSIYLHLAGDTSKNWLMRDFLWFMFAYPFKQLDCNTIFAAILISNDRCLRLAKKLGFIQHRESSEDFNGEKVLILSLHRDQCRYL